MNAMQVKSVREESQVLRKQGRLQCSSAAVAYADQRLQRKAACACGGGCPHCKAAGSNPSVLQKQLSIGVSNDRMEQEAERVADQVLTASPHSDLGNLPLRIQRFSESGSAEAITAPRSVDRVLANMGKPLEESIQKDMSLRFGHDFSDVRTHSGEAAEQSAKDVDANAYTVGNNIVFGENQYAPATQQGKRLLAHELTHVVQQNPDGRRDMQRQEKIHRQVGGTGGLQPQRRTVVIDANVIGEINRGNVQAAQALRNMTWQATVCISNQAYKELTAQPGKMNSGTGPDLARTAAANQLLLRDMNIAVAPAGDAVKFNEVILANSKAKNTISAEDIQSAAAAKANDAELWSFDKSYRVNKNPAALEKRLGIQIAPETYSIPLTQGSAREDYRVARSLLGLAPVEVSVGGRIGTPQAPAGPAAVAGEVVVPQRGSVTPSGGFAKPVPTVAGEVSVPQRGSVTPAGSTARPVTAATGELTVPQRGSVTPVGGKARPVTKVSGEIGALPSGSGGGSRTAATNAAAAMAAQAFLAWQLGSVRGAERDKAIDAYNKLVPIIEAHRVAGRHVSVTVVAEVPNQIDLAAKIAGVGDPGQVVYFKKMFISSVADSINYASDSNRHATIRQNYAAGDPDTIDSDDWTLKQQIDVQMGKEAPSKMPSARKRFHYQTEVMHLPGYSKSELPGGRGFGGMYLPVSIALHREGDRKKIELYGLHRYLQVIPPGGDQLMTSVVMLGPDSVPYSEKLSFSVIGSGGKDSYAGSFIERENSKDIYQIKSSLIYKPTKEMDLIEEEAQGESLQSQFQLGSKWRAKIIWIKI